eukprot:725142_1
MFFQTTSTMQIAFHILFILSSLHDVHSTNTNHSTSCSFRFGSMALLSGSRPRKTVAAGFNMAIEDYANGYLNENKYFNITNLNNCSVSTSANMLDMKSDIKVGIVQAFTFGQSYERNDINKSDINVPFVIGPPTSGYSLTLNPLFVAFNLLQFSSTATSTFLSDYPQFFRSVPSDDLQANALIQLCAYFGWKNIGIMYMNTNYGSSLQQALTAYANHNALQTTTFSYIDGDNITIADAVESMKRSRIYIHILVAYGSDLDFITSQIIAHDMIGYPYYFLGTDSWLGNVGEDTNNLEVYGFLSLILLMLSNFCVAIMLMPRLVDIWQGHEDQVVKENEELKEKVHKYLSKMRRYKGKGTDEFSSRHGTIDTADTPIVPPTPISVVATAPQPVK